MIELIQNVEYESIVDCSCDATTEQGKLAL